jgi:hypothetical protein
MSNTDSDWVPYGTPNPKAAAEAPDKPGPPSAPIQGVEGYNLRGVDRDSTWAGAPAVGTSPAYSELQSNPQNEHTLKMLGPAGPLPVFKAFSSGFREGFGEDPVGMSSEQAQKFQDAGLFNTKLGTPTGFMGVFKAINETLIMGGATLLDTAARTASGLYRGAQGAGVEAGLPRDVVSIPDAYMGSPGLHPGEVPKPGEAVAQDANWSRNKSLTYTDIAQARETGVVGPERPSINEGTPAEVAHKTIQPTAAYHGSPYDFDAFDSGKIGTGEGAQSYGHGLYFAEHPAVATEYAGKTIPASAIERLREIDKLLDTTPEGNYRDALRQEMDDLETKQPGNTFQVKIHANKNDFMSHDLPANSPEQPAGLKAAYKKAGMDLTGATDGADAYHQLSVRLGGDEAASAALAEAGVPGIKYLDQGSRVTADSKAELEQLEFMKKAGPPPEKAGIAYDKIRWQQDIQTKIDASKEKQAQGTHNFVVFDHNLVEITHKNGEAVPPKPSSLPVPTEEAGLPAKQGSRELMSPEDTAFAQRLDEFIGKLEVPEDFKNLLREAAQRGGTFTDARTGDIPLSHQGSLEEATGMRLDEMTLRGMGRLLKNDGEVRVAMQTLLTTTDKVFEAARDADMTGDPKDLIALQEQIMRRDLALEQVVGLRAEWGRTGNVFQEFTEKVNDAQTLGQFLKDKGKYTVDDLKTIAKNLRGLNDRGAQARLLTDLRKPTLWDKWMYTWTNGLLSGLFTHARYLVGNTMFAAYDAMVITPTAGAIGAARQLFSKDAIDRVFIGEGPARVWGMVKGTEQGIIAASRAIASGVPDALPRQVALNVNPYTGQKPIKGVVGSIIGIPSHAIAAIHTFYNVIGYRAQIEAEAYRSAARAGLKPTDPNFWTHMHDQSMFPTEDAMDAAVKNGSRTTFTDPLGPKGQALQVFLNTTKVGKMVVPFLRVSSNVFKAAQEATPGSLLNKDMRDNLAGRNGDIARDTQYARLAAGTAIGGMVAYWAANDHITDNGPPNKEDHDIWRLTHEPNSVKIGNYWVSYDRLGPLGPYLGMVAGLTHSIKDINDKDVGTATERIVLGISQDIVNEVGMQGLSDLIQAKTDPVRYGKKYVANLGASFIPFSSGASQWASVMDPEQRTTNNLVDVMKSKVPWLRETLYPVRDWKGLPLANSREELGAVIKNRQVNVDPIDQEMSALQIHPTKVEGQIKGVQLTPDQYDRYQTTAGVLTQTALTALIKEPAFQQMPAMMRETQIKATIESTRKAAETKMLIENGGALLKQTLQVQMDKAQGIKPDKSKTLMQSLGVTQ